MKLCDQKHLNDDNATECRECGSTTFLPPIERVLAPLGPGAWTRPPTTKDKANETPADKPAIPAEPLSAKAPAQSGANASPDLLQLSNQETVAGELQRFSEGAKRPRVVVLFGHSMSGKSFFVLRLKKMARQSPLKFVQVKPPLPTKDVYEVEGTEGMHLHMLKRNNKDAVVIVDLAGEAFEDLITGKMHASANDAARTDRQLLLVVEALADADGFIFMMPALETLFPDLLDRTHLTDAVITANVGRDRSGELIDNLSMITNAIAWLAVKENRAMEPVARAAEMIKYLRSPLAGEHEAETRCEKPALLLFSKADLVEQMAETDDELRAEDFCDRYDFDPWSWLAQSEHSVLIYELFQRFARPKVDYVSAAHGHRQVRDDDPKKYNKILDCKNTSPVGVAEALLWMCKEIDRTRSWTWKIRRYLTAPVLLRRLLDPGFASPFKRD
jgi:hypothetical protein